MNSLNQSTMSFGSNISSRSLVGDDELDTCSIISFGSHRSANKSSSNVYKNQQQLEIKAETVYSLLSMLTCNNIKEEMCNKFYSMSLDRRLSLEMRSHGCIPLLIQLIHPIGEDARYLEEGENDNQEIECKDDMSLYEDSIKRDQDGHYNFDNFNDFQSRSMSPVNDDDEEITKAVEIRNKACIALRNIIKHGEETKVGRKEMKVLQLLEEIRGFCDKFKRGKGDLSVSMAHPSEATSHLMKISFDEEHRIAVCLLGGLHAIAELIFFDTKYHGNTTSPQCITVRRYAFMALTNLTFGDGTNKSILCSNKLFIRSLIEQLYSPSEELRQVTASVLRNLSWKADDQGKDTLREMGAVRMLMRAALEAKKESTLKSILTALWNLSAHSTINKAEICAVEGALKFLISTLNYQSHSNTMVIIENGGGILRNVSSYIARHEHLRAILRDYDTLSLLLEQLQSPSLTIVSNACATLWNLSARCLQDQLKLIELGAIPMLRNLVNSKHKMISMGSAAALKNLSSVKNYHLAEPFDSSCSSSSRNSACNSPSTNSTTPTLLARKSNGFRPELDDSLSETCDNLESPKSSPAHVRRFHLPPPINRYDLPDRMLTSFTVPTLSNPYPYMSKSSSKDSLGSTHSEPVYYPFNNRPQSNHNNQPHLNSASPRSSSQSLNPNISNVSSSFTHELSHLFHAYPIKVGDDKGCDRDSLLNYKSSFLPTNVETLDQQILDNARLNVENLLSSSNGPLFSKPCSNSVIKCASDDNITLGCKSHDRLPPRRKSSADSDTLDGRWFKTKDVEMDERNNDLSNRLTNICHPKFDNTNDQDFKGQSVTLIDLLSPSVVGKKIEEAIEEESEESLQKEESATIKISVDDQESIMFNQKINSSIASSQNNQSINCSDNYANSMETTPLMFSRTSSLGSISGLEIKSIGTSISSVPSEFSKVTSDPVSPDDLPYSPTEIEPLSPLREETKKPQLIRPTITVLTDNNNNIKKLEPKQIVTKKKEAESHEMNSSNQDDNPLVDLNPLIESQAEALAQIYKQFENISVDNNSARSIESQKVYKKSTYDFSTLTEPESSVSLYSLESIGSIKPPSCIDEASLSLESSNFTSMEFNNCKPDPPKVISTIYSAEARKNGFNSIEGLLESTNPPSDMEAISGLSSSCGSLNSLDSIDEVNLSAVKEFDLEATKLIKKQTQDIILLTESHNTNNAEQYATTADPPKPVLQRNDTFNCDGQNESEDDSRATYICSPRKPRIVKPVLRIQSTYNNSTNANNNKNSSNSANNKSVIRRYNSLSSANSKDSSSSDSLSVKNKSLIIKGTKTTSLRSNRSKSTPEGQHEQSYNGNSNSVPSTPVKKLSTPNSNNNFSSKTYVIRKKMNSSSNGNSIESENYNSNNTSGTVKDRSLSTNKMCNSSSIQNIVDKITGNLQHSSSSTLSSVSSVNKRTPVQSKIASLWKRSQSEKENVTTKYDNNVNNGSRCKMGEGGGSMTSINKTRPPSIPPSPSTPSASSTSTMTSSNLTRSSTYEKLPSSPGEAIKMQPSSTVIRKETKEPTSRVPLTKNRIRPAQDQITASLNKQSKVVRLETKRKASLVN